MNIGFPNIELYPATINNTVDVNPYPMDDVQIQVVNGELVICMRGHVGPKGELPGALVGFTLPVVNTVLGKQMLYSSLEYEIKSDEASLSQIGCVETDLKWCIEAATDPASPIANVMGGDAQKHNGAWEIYNDWVGKTSFHPGPFAANTWTKVALRHAINPSKGQFSFTSIIDGSKTFIVPSTLQNMPMLVTNWAATGVQIQLCLNRTGFAVIALRNITVRFSDSPI
jgi:hypothetical protein